MHLCRIENTIGSCGCIPADAPDLNISSWSVPVCSKEGNHTPATVFVGGYTVLAHLGRRLIC